MADAAARVSDYPLVLVVDIGTSSLRASVYDARAREVPGLFVRRPYQARTTPDGGAELDPGELFEAFASALDELLARAGSLSPSVIAFSSLASSMLGIDEQGNPLTPLYLYSDTRSAPAVATLRASVDWTPIYQRTGCPCAPMYLPPRFIWLRETQPEVFRRCSSWLSLSEFILNRLFGQRVVSHSIASWTGLLDRAKLDWDDELLHLSGVRRDQLSELVPARTFLTGLADPYRQRWPSLAGVPFMPAIGDGATANVGSGCTDPSRVGITVGTSAAVRVVTPAAPPPRIPAGLWLYSVDERRALLGGSLNNGGNVYAYLRQTLNLSMPDEEDRELAAVPPDAQGLTVLPFFAGERSPGYHSTARAAVVGLNLDSAPLQILHAVLEAIAYRIAAVFDLIVAADPGIEAVIASGSALLHSTAWLQILADVLGRPVTASGEAEASARGAAVLALGALNGAERIEPAPLGNTFVPRDSHHEVYRQARERHEQLYKLLIGPE